MAGLLTINELIKQKNISRATIYRYLEEGMQCIKVGKKNMFDPDVVDEFISQRKNVTGIIEVGKEYSNSEICNFFRCGVMGIIRKSNSKKAIVCISSPNVARFPYKDYWDDDILYFYGQGIEGDQSLKVGFNKTLAESRENGFTIYLFEKFKEGKHIYRGIAKLISDIIVEEIMESDGFKRKVFVFPLKLINEKDYPTEEQLEKEENSEEKDIEFNDKEVVAYAKKYVPTAKRKVIKTRYQRNMFVAEYAKLRANGICELCRCQAPFEVNGKPYLEVSHLIPLALGGEDTIENVAALCPNCHRKTHIINSKEDMETIRKNIEKDEICLQDNLHKKN